MINLQPKESSTFLEPNKLPVLSRKVAVARTAVEPKQVAIDPQNKIAVVSCMKGKSLQFFDFSDKELKLKEQINFREQCVEVVITGGYCFVTTTNFPKLIDCTSKIHIIDLKKRRVISSVNTGGSWSKAIGVNLRENLAFVSNWKSNNVSVIDLSDIKKPKLVQVLPCGKSPRGIATFANSVWVATYYSRNILELERRNNGQFFIKYSSPPFDVVKYQGNMRDILISKKRRVAYVTNMGRSLVHAFSLDKREFIKSISVGKYPNSIRFTDKTEKKILVSCSKSNSIYIVNLNELKVIGRSQTTGELPTGLATYEGGFLVTNFRDNNVEMHSWK